MSLRFRCCREAAKKENRDEEKHFAGVLEGEKNIKIDRVTGEESGYKEDDGNFLIVERDWVCWYIIPNKGIVVGEDPSVVFSPLEPVFG